MFQKFTPVILALLSMATGLFGQTALKATIKPQLQVDIVDDGKEVITPFDGTYQFIFTQRVKQAFTDKVLETIELNRKDEEEVTITLSPYTRIQILSRKQIHTPGFTPFVKSYVFEN